MRDGVRHTARTSDSFNFFLDIDILNNSTIGPLYNVVMLFMSNLSGRHIHQVGNLTSAMSLYARLTLFFQSSEFSILFGILDNLRVDGCTSRGLGSNSIDNLSIGHNGSIGQDLSVNGTARSFGQM
jgi:hypothetical protein